jgi:hypothetical protein
MLGMYVAVAFTLGIMVRGWLSRPAVEVTEVLGTGG